MLRKIVLMLLLVSIMGCSGGKMEEQKMKYKKISDVPASAWEKLSKKKIYFGHQSVGNNIIEGINELIVRYPQIKLNIVETTDLSMSKKSGFIHSKIGKNTDPKSKIDMFKKNIDSSDLDIAMLKLCYVDFKAKSNIEEIFDYYSSTIELLEKANPNIKIVHFTAPLVENKFSFKVLLKKILNKKIIWELDDNVTRNLFNKKIVKKYSMSSNIFNIALIESTKTDGARVTFNRGNSDYYSLNPEYTDDGSHLNTKGRVIVAEQLLLLLVSMN